MGRGRGQPGQATVEVVLVLPLVVLLGLVVAQLGLVTLDALLLHHAVREAARAAAVDPDPGVAAAAGRGASSLDAGRLSIQLGGGRSEGDTLVVTGRYRSPTEVPMVGWMVDEVELSATASMRVE